MGIRHGAAEVERAGPPSPPAKPLTHSTNREGLAQQDRLGDLYVHVRISNGLLEACEKRHGCFHIGLS